MNNIFSHHKEEHPFWANACVGNNGNPGIWTYADGFIKSAELIISSTIKKESRVLPVDELVYPACFNLRHALELSIKAATISISEIAKIKGTEVTSDIENSHDILNIWESFKIESISLDQRYAPIIASIDKIITSLAEADPTGQTFRYPTSTESNKHLTDVAIINFFQLKELSEKIRIFIEEIKNLCFELTEEYKLGTFTKKLNRNDIESISRKLPPLEEWQKEKFDKIKSEIKEEYGISGRELSKAINIIKRHHQFSQNIDSITPLHDSKNNHLGRFFYWSIVFFSCTSTLTQPPNQKKFSPELHEIIEYGKRSADIQGQAWKDFSSVASPAVQAGVASLYYFSNDLNYSEYFRFEYEYFLREFDQNGMASIKNNFLHILKKSDAIPSIIQSLNFLGHSEMSEKLIKCYSLRSHFHSIK